MTLSRSGAFVRLLGAALVALAVGVAVNERANPVDGYLAFALVAVLLSGLVLLAAIDPAVTISAGLALSIFSGQFSHLGSPVGLDRLVLVAGIGTVLVRELRSEHPRLRTERIHIALALVTTWAIGSAIWVDKLTDSSAFFSLLDNLGIVPFLLFWIAPAAFPSERERRILLGTLVGIGLYLGVTAILETTGPTSLVFPRYIMDPYVGIHFGRARGPFVEAAANGLAMLVCATAAAMAVARWRGAWRVFAGVVVALCALGMVFTLTRQVWVAAIAGTLVAMASRRELWRYVVPTCVVGVVAVLAVFSFVPGFSGRAQNRLESQLPVWDRLNSNAAASRMAEAKPVTGFGWATFPDHPEFYRQAADRPLTVVPRPHNVFLANAAELGVLATLAWIACLVIAFLQGIARRGPPDLDVWRTGLIAVACGWVVVANLTPMNYAFCHGILWLWLGICRSRT
jgi:putative inorganic carbon (hco3(-)) transporter